MTSFEKGDRVVLVRPYTINGTLLGARDRVGQVKPGDLATFRYYESGRDEHIAIVTWDRLGGSDERRIDVSCLGLDLDEGEVDEALQSIARTFQERGESRG